MERALFRSGVTILAAFLVSFTVLALEPVALLLLAQQLSSGFLDAHPQAALAITFALCGLLGAILAGATIGRLAPSRPVAHTLAATVVLLVVGLLVTRLTFIPSGGQLAALACQVALASAVAALTWGRFGQQTVVDQRAI